MEGEAGVDRVEVDVEDPADPGQPLVERRAGQVGGGRRRRLVPALLQVGPQGAEQLLPGMLRVVRQQRAELPFDERLHPGLVAQQMQQPGQSDVW
ncbi:hypothetical protein GCM10029963_71100 [Micromonospora andamanensis]